MMKNPSILIVDDEPDNFDAIEILLSEREYQLNYVPSGRDAIASLDIFQPDLILLDVMMPEMDGIEVCRQIKAKLQWRSIPIVMVTALTAKEDLARCLEAGADDFISKPVNRLELRARIQSMLRIKHHYDDLQTLLKLRQDLANMLVHDLRNPLTTILAGLKLLKSIEYPKEKQSREMFDRVDSSAQTLQVFIDDLLEIAMSESGKLCLHRTEVDLCHLVHSVLSNFEAIAAQKNLLLVSQCPKESKRKVYIDLTLMHRTLDNLLSNAIKFSPHHSQIVAKVEFLASSSCKIQVIDSGRGVPDALRQKIFEKYEIGTPMSDIAQIGLGLAFCKMVVEAHGGRICVKHNQPQGAIFEILLGA